MLDLNEKFQVRFYIKFNFVWLKMFYFPEDLSGEVIVPSFKV